MRVAVIGAGKWGMNHVRTLRDLGVLAAVADTSPAVCDRIRAEMPDVETCVGYESLLNAEIDAVSIATSAPTHFEIARSFLRAGKDVLVEKPITLSSEEAEALRDLAAEHGRVLMVGHLLMYHPAVVAIRDAIEAGRIGKLLSLHQERLNLGRARAVENVLWSLGVHDVAVLLYLVGCGPESVEATGHAALQPTVEDDMYLHMRFPGGIQAHLHCSWLWPELRRRLTVVGTEGMLVFDEVEKTVVLHRKRIDERLENVNEGTETLFAGSAQPLTLELQHFLDRVRDRTMPRSDAASALEVVRVLEKASKNP
jgi:predicted dehydrogenase